MTIQKEHFGNFPLTGCFVGKDNEYLFIGREPLEYYDPYETMEIKHVFYRSGEWSSAPACSSYNLFADYTTEPENAWVMLASHGNVLRIDGNGREWEEKVPPPPGFESMIFSRARTIAGKLYGASHFRTLFRRDGINQWTWLHNGLPSLDEMYDKDIDPGFYDMDGFAEDDLYAIGEKGDIWHWDGDTWSKKEIPLKKDIDSIVCGDDGVVYMNVGYNDIIYGRGDDWKRISHCKSDPFNNMRWFRDRIYMATGLNHFGESTIYEFKNGRFRESPLNKMEGKPYRCTFMDAGDDVLLMGTRREVAAFDGEKFVTILPEDPDFDYSGCE